MFGGGTRQFDIAIDIDGDTSRVRPGVSAAVAISCQTFDAALSVPRSAVFEVAGKRVVYVRTPAGFETRDVTVAAFTETAAIVEGIETDVEVALVNPNAAVGSRTPQSQPARAL